jgi:CheY-like chemotaxis protein
MQWTSRTPGGDRIRILIVDQHEVSRAACAALLRTEGLDVVDVPGAGGLVGLTRVWMPDVVLIDVSAPGPGVQAVRQLRSRAHVPAIVLTSSAQPRQLHRGLAELPFLPKADICARAILAAAALGGDEQSAAVESE